jgi:Ca2+-binding RTX toxin-like protein
MKMPSIKPFDITLSDINFLLDQMREAITILRYDSQGRPIYGYIDSAGVSHDLGLFGDFNPLNVTDAVTGLSIYDGAREASGFRIPAGFFNNLVDLTRWSWGAVNEPFPRLTEADYLHYVTQVLSNPALTNGSNTGYVDLHSTVTDPSASTTLATPAAYADLNKTVVDYTPRMITQTISSSYGAPGTATATGIMATAGSDAMLLMAPGELLIVNTGSGLVVFQFYDGASTTDPSTGNLVGIDVRAGVTVAAALLALQAGLQGAGNASGATVGLDGSGHISIALGSAQEGSLAIFDYAGLGLGGTFDPVVDNSSGALIRTGVWTDVFTSTGVIGDADGVVTEYVARNLNTLPGDPSMSGIFTLFGQFFDHGLDFIDKGGQGAKIIIPLAPTDPLYGAIGPDGQPTTAITISRATPDGYTMQDIHGRQVSIAGADTVWGATATNPTGDDVLSLGADGVLGGGDDVLGIAVKPADTVYTDHTSPYIDQSQSYGSDTQITRLLREWVQDPNTGAWRPGAELLDGHHTQAYHSQVFHDVSSDSDPAAPAAGMTTRTVPTLAELRAHLLATGRDDLSWDDINNYRARDDSGHVIDTNGASTGGYVYTGQAILLDMNPHVDSAHVSQAAVTALNAAAGLSINWVTLGVGDLIANGLFNPATSMITATDPAVYAAVSEIFMQSVGDHYIVGDGRGNENFGLTAMHHVFHENHNVQLVNLENMILSSPDVAARHGYQLAVSDGSNSFYTDTNGNYTLSDHTTISWDPDKLFEATKLINEMEYQHVAIDQYARLVTPDLPEFVTYDNDINADISLEYAQAAFRFGHSQLRDTIDAIDPNGTVTKWALSAAFLNPGAYAATGAENILRGMSQQLGNDVDEFLTPAMQQSLLGQPLDLGAINIARGRDLGMPTLNEVRRQLHDALVAERAADPSTPHHTNLIVDALNPYTSWAEFGSQMQHPDSLVNFIAAYSFDGDLAKAQEVMDLETGVISTGTLTGLTTQTAIEFLNGADDGYNKIDFWIGGLSELHVFTGQVGTTFNAIFEDQMERLMDGDRFYYLYRLGTALNIDPDLGHMVVTEQFKDIIERTTGALHLNGDVMGYADSNIELAKTHAADLALPANAGLGMYSGSGNGTTGNGSILTKSNTDLGLVNQQYIADFRPDVGENPDGTPATGYNAHEVIAGTDFNDWLDAGNGDDTLYGDKGNDVLDGKAGADHIYGGDGQDVIYGGDIEDFLDGGAGDDIVYAGTSAGALDVVIGGAGNDKLYGEAGIDEMYGAAGDDYIDAGGDTDLAFGDSGNDIMFGGDGPDELRGGIGDDILSGGSGADMLKGEQGDDIMLAGIGQAAQVGDADEALGDVGFDMTSFSDVSIVLGIPADLRNLNLTAANGGTPFQPFNQLWSDIEGVIGSKFDDTIIGADSGAVAADGVTQPGDNWLVGGGGNDTFNTRTPDPSTGSVGGGGNDVIIGDSIRLDTLIGRYDGYTNNFDANGNATHGYTGSLSAGLLANATLGTEMFAKHYTDLLKTEARKDFVLGDDPGSDGSNDVAIFTGNKSNYSIDVITFNSPNEGTVTAYKITDNRDPLATDANGVLIPTDGTDLVVGVDVLRFLDGDIHLPLIAPTLDLHAYNITNGSYADNLNTAAFNNSTGLTPWTTPWSESNDSTTGNVVTGGQIQIDSGGGGGTNQLRILDDGDGASIQRAVNLSGFTAATLGFSYSESSFDGNNERVVVSFSFDNGAHWHQLATFTSSTGNGGNFNQNLLTLLGPGESFGPNGIIKFEAFTANGGNGYIAIDSVNVSLTQQTAVNDASNNYSTTFTEGGSSVAIASGPGITDDGTVIYSAKVVLTNAKPNDTLNRNDINGDGITGTTDTSVLGQITVNLTGASTFAAYQAAIQAITFSNNSQNPDPADRIIQVTVKDELINSNIATTTIHVTPVNDAPNASNDSIVTNISGAGAVVIPDWALLANDTDADSAALTVSTIVITNSANATHASGAVTFTDTGSSATNSGGNQNGTMGTFDYRASDNAVPVAATDTATATVTRDTGNIDAGNGNQIIVGDTAASTIDPGTGNDIVFAGAGGDTIQWNANNSGATDGRDFVDGGTTALSGGHDTTSDTFVVSGNNNPEVYRIYSNTDDWNNDATDGVVSSAAHAGLTGLNANTEVVITRNTNGVVGAVTNANIIAELDNVEEIIINSLNSTANNNNNPNQPDGGTTGTGATADTIQVVGNFTSTSLNYSTITINGSDGDETVDISGLTSDHRVVFHGGRGNNHVVGVLRPQDVVDNQTASSSTGGNSGSDLQGNSTSGTGNDGWSGSGDNSQGGNSNAQADLTPVLPSVVQADALAGTPADDVLVGGVGDDAVSGVGGDDLILGNNGADTLKGGDGDDLIKGGAGDDVAFGNAGNDDVFGGAGQDMLFGDQGNDRLFGDDGNDTVEGGTGNDTVYAGSGDDRVLATVSDGDDIYWGENGRDTVDYSAYTADVKVDLGNGLLQHGSVASAQGGNDTIFGFENFIGGSGNDTIVASAAANAMDGGSGNDTFVFKSATDANGDSIKGFQPGDKIDLSGIDANTASSGNQSFVLFAGTGFTAAGQLIVTHEVQDGVEHTIVAGNTNNDAVADFEIDVVGNNALTPSDFHSVN